jgi:hypothetical protein
MRQYSFLDKADEIRMFFSISGFLTTKEQLLEHQKGKRGQ